MAYIIRLGAPLPISPGVTERLPINIQEVSGETDHALQILDPNNNHLFAITQDGDVQISGGFSCFTSLYPAIGGVPQTAVGPACTANVTSIVTLLNNIRTALLATGIVQT